ncbi:MAG: TetR/AcrR family transcriptional regulator [Thermoguttaceae bacterium]|nr:TetR/AcrR family transcriptional regulator [Thermoguttaceae bacterium]
MARLMDQHATLMRDGIYDAAVTVLDRDGLDAMTMERVAEEAGVAKGSLYNYFQNKTDLLKFVHERTLEPLRQEAQEILDTEAAALEKLKAFIALCFRYMEERRGLLNFLFNEHAIHKFVRAPRTEGGRYLATIIRQGIKEKTLRPVEPEFHGTLLFGAIRQVLEEQLANDKPWAVEDMTNGVVRFFLDGVKCPTSSPVG